MEQDIHRYGWLDGGSGGLEANAMAIAVGGNNMVFIRGDHTLFGKTGQGGPWNQMSGVNAATAVAVNANGLVLMIGTDNAIYSRVNGAGTGMDTKVGPGNAAAIALSSDASNTMMFLRGDGMVFAKNGAGGPWTQQTVANSGTAIAIGSNGLELVLAPNGTVISTGPVGSGWTAETASNAARAITAS